MSSTLAKTALIAGLIAGSIAAGPALMVGTHSTHVAAHTVAETRFTGLPRGGLSDEAMRTLRANPQILPVVRFYRGFETGDASPYTSILQRNWLDVPLNPGQTAGRSGFASVLAGFHTSFPDLSVHIEEIVVSGNTVVVRTTTSGTQKGTFLGVAPTNRKVQFRTADVHHLSHGLIASTYHLEDLFGAYTAITSPASN